MLGPGTQGRPQDQAGDADDDEEDADRINDETPRRAAGLAAVQIENESAETARLVLDFGFAAFALNDRFDEMARRLEDDAYRLVPFLVFERIDLAAGGEVLAQPLDHAELIGLLTQEIGRNPALREGRNRLAGAEPVFVIEHEAGDGEKQQQHEPEQGEIDMERSGPLQKQAVSLNHGAFFLAYSTSVSPVSAFFSKVMRAGSAP